MISHFCSAPSDAEIREEAYRIFCYNGRVPGRELEHWLVAKERLLDRAARNRSDASAEGPLNFPLNAAALRVDTPHPFPNLHRA